MARELRRLLIPPARLTAAAAEADALGDGRPPLLALQREEAHYLGRVLRLRPGERFAVVDGAGRLWGAALLQGDQARLEQPLSAPLEQQPPPSPPVELAVALPRRDADVLLRMACELGIDRLQPLQAERSSSGPDPLKSGRGLAILREAMEQCERLWLPELAAPVAASSLLGAAPAAGPGWGLLATTRRPGIPLLLKALEELSRDCETAGVSAGVTVAIGPEGGWSPAEEARAFANGWQAVSLGATILRCSTAAVTAAALLNHWRQQG